jgi:hypothetical protein
MPDPSSDVPPRASPAPASPPSEAAELEIGTLEATLPPRQHPQLPEDELSQTPADTEQGDKS